jgi:hypothetical protein
MATTLKAHWQDLLTQIADAGPDGIRAANVDKRAAAALERRDLITAFEKQQYIGLDKPFGKSTWYRLTDSGSAWVVAYRENPTTSRALPAGWTMVAAGHYVHTASRVEVRRTGRVWAALRPLSADPDGMWSVIETTSTRAAAFTAAARAIPAALELAAAVDFQQTGRPETWPAGQADEATVDARHLAVSVNGARTGYQAKPDERVIHVELGTRGTFVHGDGDCSYVVFDGEGGSDLVHSGDVVVITEPRTVGTFAVTREAQHADDTDLGSATEPGGDFYLLVDGRRIGGTYWCFADDFADGQRWASWGVAGLSRRNRTREDAENVQVREYVTDPSGCDRRLDDYEREQQDERDRREAELAAEEAAWAEARRIKMEGDDGPGETIWTLPPHHALIGELDDVTKVQAWLAAHDLDMVSAAHEIRVEQRATRRVIVVQQARFFGRCPDNTETRAVTLIAEPSAVDTTPRPDLVDMLVDGGHWPSRFPLIDFGQTLACSACTRESGDPTKTVAWPCPPFVKQRDVGAVEIVLAAAERALELADGAVRSADLDRRDTIPEENMLQAAQIQWTRARLALSVARHRPGVDAQVRFIMVTCSDDDGSTWRPVHWLGMAHPADQTASAQALWYAGHHRLTADDDAWLCDAPKPYRVEVYTNPLAAEPDGVWTNLADLCRPGRHDTAGFPIVTGPARADGSVVEHGCCARCLHRVWRVRSDKPGRWLPEGDPLGPDDVSDPPAVSDLDPAATVKVNSGPDAAASPKQGPIAFGYRIETRIGRRWRTVRFGNAPANRRSDPTAVWATADSILGNVRQVLGLGPKDRMPGVRVRAWDRQSGLTRLVARRADRTVNQRG